MVANSSLCPVCRSDSFKLIETKAHFAISRCSQCELVFASPTPSEEALRDFYNGFQYARLPESAFATQVTYTENGTQRFLKTIADLRNGEPVRAALDFGGGLGFFAAALANKCDKVVLFDLDPRSLNFAKEKFGGKFKVNSSAESALDDGPYDLILLNQVIEHVTDPVALLRNLKRALAPNGIIAITTPNNRTNDFWLRPELFYHHVGRAAGSFRERLSVLATNSWLSCDPPRHLFSFNEKSLGKASTEAGLDPRLIVTAYFDVDPFGQPTYRFSGLGRLKNIARTLLFAMSKFSGPILRALDRRGTRGTTLIGYLQPNKNG
jgi:SAM-dependent methyltransferase